MEKKLTEEESKRLKELLALKKANKLSEADQAELDALNKKMGYKPGKGNGNNNKGTGFKPGNDFSWWNKYPELTKDAANYKSNYIAGDTVGAVNIPYVVPGVIKVKLWSVWGKSKSVTDPLNVWARDLYLKMFQRFRVPSSYSASDLGIALIAAIEVVKAICYYERIYGVINRYAKRNLNMPFTEAAALGLSAADVDYLQGHLADFRGDLNFLIQKAQRLVVPKDLSVVADAISLFGYSYLDHDNARAQIIEFVPEYFGIYSDNAMSSGGSISYEIQALNTDLFSYSADNMCIALDNMLNALLGSDSIQRIFADITTWFGEEALLKFAPIPSDYVTVPAYSESMLHKLHNLECVSASQNVMHSWVDGNLGTDDANYLKSKGYVLYQCADKIISRPTFISVAGNVSWAAYDNGELAVSDGAEPAILPAHVLDTYRADMNEETVVEGVMYKSHLERVHDSGAGTTGFSVSCCNFYIASTVQAYKADLGFVVYWIVTNVHPSAINARDAAACLAILDWAPLSYVAPTGSTQVIDMYGDVDCVIEMPTNGLAKLSRVIIMSGLYTGMTVKA